MKIWSRSWETDSLIMQANSTERVKKHRRGIKNDLRELLAGQADLREQQDEMGERLREICAMLAEQR